MGYPANTIFSIPAARSPATSPHARPSVPLTVRYRPACTVALGTTYPTMCSVISAVSPNACPALRAAIFAAAITGFFANLRFSHSIVAVHPEQQPQRPHVAAQVRFAGREPVRLYGLGGELRDVELEDLILGKRIILERILR